MWRRFKRYNPTAFYLMELETQPDNSRTFFQWVTCRNNDREARGDLALGASMMVEATQR